MEGEAMVRRIDPEGWPRAATMSQAVVHGSTVYVSGVVPMDTAGNLVGGDDAAAQARAVLDNIEAILDAAGSSLQDILRLTCFATSIEACLAYVAERGKRITTRPAATAVAVSELMLPGAMLEVEVIARLSEHS